MADSEKRPNQNSSKKKKKRKQISTEEEEEIHSPLKNCRLNSSERKSKDKLGEEAENKKLEVNVVEEGGSPWRNLQLILSIQNNHIDIPTNIELAFNYVKSRALEEDDDSSRVTETVSLSRVVAFMNSWIQTVLISSAKKSREEECKSELETGSSCLDHRCWVIFKFCLEESMKLNVSLIIQRDFLRVLHFIATNVLSYLNDESVDSHELALSSGGVEYEEIVLSSISLVFSSHGGVLDENLDLWIMLIDVVLKLLKGVVRNKLDESRVCIFVLQLSSYLLESFAKFLRVHPTRKNAFSDFIDRLLEPLMHLSDELHHYTCIKNPELTKHLLKLVEEVLSQGLFHPTHIDGFLNLDSTSKYRTSDEGKSKDGIRVIKSYHRHLFDKLEKIIAGKNILPLAGVGELLRFFVSCVMKQKAGPYALEDPRHLEGRVSGQNSERSYYTSNNLIAEKQSKSGASGGERQKPMFDFFVQIMECFLFQIQTYVQTDLEVGNVLEDVLCIFRSTNKLLVGFKAGNIYVRTEDTSEGASANFLRFIYETVMSFSAKLNVMLMSSSNWNGKIQETVILLMKELVVSVNCLLDIEYEVVGDNLHSLWAMMLSFSACSQFSTDVPEHDVLTLEILHLGCHLIDLYKELRQVNTSIFALCKAVRLSVSPFRDSEAYNSSIYSSYANSLSMFLCSPKFRSSMCNAIKSIPEGQTGGCIRQLTADIFESLESLNLPSELAPGNDPSKLNSSDSSFLLDLQAELLGRNLSEIYTLILDSITVTTGNSNPVCVSVKDLMARISNGSSALDSLKSDRRYELFSVISGRASGAGLQLGSGTLSQWLLVFFFRLYLSSRSLYRQVMSLVNPDASRKMSEAMSDSYTAYSGKDWLESVDQKDEGYFSWIIQPSASLLDVIETVSNIYLQDTHTHCPPLIYLLNTMALQGLVDLNRKIQSFKYLIVKNDNFFETKMIDESGVHLHRKRNKKWTKCLLNMEKDAAGLTKFMMRCVLSLVNEHLSLCSSKDGSSINFSVQNLGNDNGWDLSVGALNKKSLPSALWLIICQNIDIWCAHAAKKELKKFLKLLIQCSLPCFTCRISESGSNCKNIRQYPKNITTHQVSLELLRDTLLYEQKFVCRHIASSFHQILEMSLSSIFSDLDEVCLDSLPNWSEIILKLGTSSTDSFSDNHAKNKHAFRKPRSQSLLRLAADSCHEEVAPSSIKYASCHSLLNLLNWMPKGNLSSKSFLLLATCILNVERLVVGGLLGWHNISLSENRHELFRLLLSCRRTVKNLLMVSADEKTNDYDSSLVYILSKDPSSVLWLVKSLVAVIESQYSIEEDIVSEAEDMLFPLMDHTSHMFLTIGRYQLKQAIQSSEKGSEGKPVVGGDKHMTEHELHSELPNHHSWRSIAFLADIFREHMQNSLSRFKSAYVSEKVGGLTGVQELLKLSPMISCVQGFLWGLASELEITGLKRWASRLRLAKSEGKPLYKLSVCIDECTEFVNYFINLMFLKDGMPPCRQPNGQALNVSISGQVLGSLHEVDGNVNDGSDEEVGLNSGLLENFSASPNMNGESNIKNCVPKENLCPQITDVESLLTEVQMFDPQCLKKPLLHGLLRGQNPEAAYFLRNLFFASSAILRLKLKIGSSPLLQSLIAVLIGISQFLLYEFGSKVGESPPFALLWLDGVIKFLEELGSWFLSSSPLLSRNLYGKLIDLHLMAIGKCIVLQGRRTDVASKDFEPSNNNRTSNQSNISNSILNYEAEYLDKLKTRLRMSFRVLIQKSSDLHFLTAIQAVERAVVGVQESFMSNYEICTDILNGGSVSLTVAAGIDCLNLILEFIPGRERLNMVKRHIQSFIASQFNIILHLQGPYIFSRSVSSGEVCSSPDSGSVIFMCIEVLTRISGKHALFQMDSCHIVQALHLPAALFQNYLKLHLSEALGQCKLHSTSDTRSSLSLISTNGCILDQQFSVNLYAACCQLLCTVVKHHKSETQRCVAILEDTVNVLLHCLEVVNMNPVVRNDNFVGETQRAVKFACSLRRVYEELRQQKDTLGRYCIQFLSCYIWVYCGYGPLKTGIRREIDEALRPGVYALIDACSADDLQHLHSVFGEGPCRSTLGTLQNDYKLNFQYEGKV